MFQLSQRYLLVGIAVLGACGDHNDPGASTAPAGASAPVVVRTDPASAADCPQGGSVVSSGLDVNHNGLLDDSEIQTRTVLCLTAPPAVVVRLRPEPAGAHCALGGTAVLSGTDTNGNGQLDDSEVTHIDYVCGEPLLTRIAAEPAGAHCTAGGVVLFIGPDANGDGQLEDSEVEQTEYQCGDILALDVTIASAADAAALANIRVIDGSVQVTARDLDTLALPVLEQITGDLSIVLTQALAQVSLPRLREVSAGVFITDNGALSKVDAPDLVHVGGALDISRNPALTELNQPSLSVSGGPVSLRDNTVLTAAKLGGPFTGSVEVSGNPALATLDVFPSTPVPINIFSNGVQTLTIGDGAELGDVSVTNNLALSSLAIVAPTIGTLTVADNTALSTVTVGASATIGTVAVSGSQLTTLSLDSAHIMGLLSVSAPVTFMGSNIVVDGDLTLDGTGFTRLVPGLPILSVGGTLHLTQNEALTSAWFQTPGGGFELTDNPVLGAMMFGNAQIGGPAVDTIHGDVFVFGNPMLQIEQFLSGIRHIAGTLRVIDNVALTDMSTDSVALIDGEIDIRANPALARADFDNLQAAGGSILFKQNPALSAIQFALLSFADMTMTDNTALPTCEIAALFARIAGVHQQSGNNDSATCP